MKMNLLPLAILTFWMNQICAYNDIGENQRQRSLQDTSSGFSQQKVTVVDTPDEFIIRKPESNDKTYDDFLSFLYRRDVVKTRDRREISSKVSNVNDLVRGKRMIIFRPLFVYKQQEIKRQRVAEQRKGTKKSNTKKPSRG